MGEVKLTVPQVRKYLGTGLQVIHDDSVQELMGIYANSSLERIETGQGHGPLSEFQLVCYRMTDLNKLIPVIRTIPKLKLAHIYSKYYQPQQKSFNQFRSHEGNLRQIHFELEQLFEWHFWPFGEEYFEQGLVVDKMTFGKLPENEPHCIQKGEFRGICNLTACQSGIPATWYNHSTRKYYCESCASRLNVDEFNRRDAQRMFGHDLCTPGKHEEVENG